MNFNSFVFFACVICWTTTVVPVPVAAHTGPASIMSNSLSYAAGLRNNTSSMVRRLWSGWSSSVAGAGSHWANQLAAQFNLPFSQLNLERLQKNAQLLTTLISLGGRSTSPASSYNDSFTSSTRTASAFFSSSASSSSTAGWFSGFSSLSKQAGRRLWSGWSRRASTSGAKSKYNLPNITQLLSQLAPLNLTDQLSTASADPEKRQAIVQLIQSLVMSRGTKRSSSAGVRQPSGISIGPYAVEDNHVSSSPNELNSLKHWLVKLSQLALPEKNAGIPDDPKQLNALWSLISLARYFLCKYFIYLFIFLLQFLNSVVC